MRTYPKLEVGAGETAKRPGWINADIHAGGNIDVVFDACGTWPFKDSSIGFVQANHVAEHLYDPFGFFAEAWRILVPSNMPNLYIRVPYGASEAGFGDLTHVQKYVSTSFACFQQGYGRYMRNPQYRDKSNPFEIVQIYQRVDQRLRWLCKPIIRKWGLKIVPFLWGGYFELVVGLRPLKNNEQIKTPGTVPVVDCMYQHEYENRPLGDGEMQEWKFFT